MRSILALSAVAAIATSVPAMAANLVINGDFSSPSLAPGSWTESMPVPGWTSGTTDTIEVGKSDSPYGMTCISSNCQNLEVNSNIDTGIVEQTITGLTADQTYTLSWYYGDRNSGGHQTMNVYFDGQLVTTDTDSTNDGKWHFNTFTVTPKGTTAVLSFNGVADTGAPSYGNEVTNVSLTSAAPEPAAWALMMLGVGGMGAALRSRRRLVAA